MEQLATRNAAGSRLRALLARHRARTSVAGVTLVEVMIVVAIMAMVAGGVMVFALPRFREAQVSTARSGALAMRRAVQDWQRLNNETTCPTVSQLIQGKHLDSASNTDDPWGQAYALVCTDDDVFVISAGPDKKKDTKDDVSVPAVRAAEGEG